jgi:serine/threonine-protein kinase HipA
MARNGSRAARTAPSSRASVAATTSTVFDAVAAVHLSDRANPLLVGRLAQHGHDIYFEYAPSFIAAGLELSPLGLPLKPGLHSERERAFGGLHGVFADSLPDGWGLRLMDRDFAKRGLDPATVTPVERLLAVGTRAMGALTYHPATDEGGPAARIDLDELAAQAERIYEGSPEEVLPALMQAGGSPAGARPKVLVDYDPSADVMRAGATTVLPGHHPYLIKFPTREDGADAGAVEIAYAAMAKAAGIAMPVVRLFETKGGRRCFGVQRFDRVPAGFGSGTITRRHVHSLGGLLHASHREFGATYDHYMSATWNLVRDQRAVLEAFRRMVFNVLAHNRDDHVKNVAFLMEPDGTWELAPAYDLTFATGPRGEHSMMVGTEGARPARAHMLAVADAANLPRAEVLAIIEEVAEAVAQWKRLASDVGVAAKTRSRIDTALVRLRQYALK